MTDEERYSLAVTNLCAKATADLRAAAGRPEAVREAILTYLRDGYGKGVTSGELIDFFCVSTPNIAEEAGYVGEAGDAIVSLFDELHERLRV